MQKGQALLEALILLIVLGSLVLAIIWLGQLQDIALQLNHSSRHSAFKFAYQKQDPSTDNNFADYINNGRWQKRDGTSLINNVSLTVSRTDKDAYINTAKKFTNVLPLFNELKLADRNIWRFTASGQVGNNSNTTANKAASTEELGSPSEQSTNSLADFDLRQLQISRFTAILGDVDSIASDALVQDNLAASPSAWGKLANHSITLGQGVTNRLSDIDSAWGRSLPNWHWLKSWAGKIPQRHLNSESGL